MTRTLLVCLLLAAGCAAPGPAPPADPEEVLEVRPLGSSAFAVVPRGARGQALLGCTSGFVITPYGVVVVDAQASAEGAELVREAILAHTDRQITHVVVTRPDPERLGGLGAYPAGVTVVAHPRATAALGRPPGLPVAGEERLFPGTPFEVVLLHPGPARFVDDVALRTGGVVFVGDLLGRSPAGALAPGWARGLGRLAALTDVTRVVPAHGEPVSCAAPR